MCFGSIAEKETLKNVCVAITACFLSYFSIKTRVQNKIPSIYTGFDFESKISNIFLPIRERSGSVVECLSRDRGAAGVSLTRVTALCPRARHINPSLVLV